MSLLDHCQHDDVLKWFQFLTRLHFLSTTSIEITRAHENRDVSDNGAIRFRRIFRTSTYHGVVFEKEIKGYQNR